MQYCTFLYNFFLGYIAAGAIIKQYPDLYLVDTSLDCVQSLTFQSSIQYSSLFPCAPHQTASSPSPSDSFEPVFGVLLLTLETPLDCVQSLTYWASIWCTSPHLGNPTRMRAVTHLLSQYLVYFSSPWKPHQTACSHSPFEPVFGVLLLTLETPLDCVQLLTF